LGLAGLGHPLLYLTPLGVRDVGLKDLFVGLRRVWRAGRFAKGRRPGLHSSSLLVLPWRGLPPVAWISRAIVRWQLARALRSVSHERPVYWLRLPTPELVDQIQALGARGVVYDCIDNYSAYPQYGEAERARLAQYEHRLAARADLVVTLTTSVAARFPEVAKQTHVVPLGVDLEVFGRPSGPIPADLDPLPRPRLGLISSLDERVDFDLLCQLATAEPAWSIVMIGPVRAGVDPGPITRMPNVHFLGPRPYETMPHYLAGMEACLIPYRRTEWTDGIFPTKLFEYLMMGCPVVATDLPGLAPYGDVIELTSDADDFIAACRRAVADCDPTAAARRRALATQHSLEARCRALHALVCSLGS
jgi:glycosyltransferase involved in cell wall biosynthesis